MSLTVLSKLSSADTSAPFVFGPEQLLERDNNPNPVANPVTCPAVNSQVTVFRDRSVYGAAATELRVKWWQDQSQLHIGQSLAPMMVPVTVPVTATHCRGDFGLRALI